mmetsp:Transcript_40526/g.94102  ORF Transcript_40526/g.94102 Transcript_40526/m.94102 type:complete len:448 (+) Transcript_40526:41-1384(+)
MAGMSGDEMRALAKDGFIYGFPLCQNYNTLYAYSIEKGNPEFKAPLNHIKSVARVFTPDDKSFVTPNSDTPYSFLWLDLRAEPVTLTLPKIEGDRYFSVQLIDMYTHNFAYLGTRTTGNAGGVYMFTGPGWSGGGYSGEGAPAKVDKVIKCETPFALAMFRTQLKGPEDLENVKAIQNDYKVEPLSSYLGKTKPESRELKWPKSDNSVTHTPKMFEILDFVLSLLPVHESEQELRSRLLKMGIGTGSFELKGISEALKEALELGMKDGWAEYEEVIEKSLAQGTMTSADLFGTREFLKNKYINRFGGAKLGIYGHSREEAFYPLYKTLDGQALDASKASYELVFSRQDQEIAQAFWSLTMYDGISQLLVANPLSRYLLNSPMLPSMKTSEDGAVTLYISSSSPGPEKESNWLPAPSGPFYMVLRLYLPKPEAYLGGWKQPKLLLVPK